MGLARLDITAVRNLRSVGLSGLRPANVFFGNNGSGKTSILESIHLLGMARSFRGGQIKSVISRGEDRCTVFGELRRASGPKLPIGVSRDREGGFQAKIGGESVRAASELADRLPLQVINADSFNLLVGSPADRRQFLDWGVFHVEHRFHGQWQRFQRALRQRNSLLRRVKMSDEELCGWSREFVDSGEQVHRQRNLYFGTLEPVFREILRHLSSELGGLQLRYRRGWDKQLSLGESLDASESTDRQQGFTHAGPQRADVRVVVEGQNAAEVLSRGQQKLVVCALKLAQGRLLEEGKRANCVYLVDDLPAELDHAHCRLVAELLARLKTQVFITCVESEEIAGVWPPSRRKDMVMFHVEHGVVEERP